jgi:hypothetical protein
VRVSLTGYMEVQERRWRKLDGSTDKKTDGSWCVSGAIVTVPEYGCTDTTVAERPKSNPRYGSVVETRSPLEKLAAIVGPNALLPSWREVPLGQGMPPR